MTQKEQIQKATHAYLLELNKLRDAMNTLRIEVKLIIDGELVRLWPSDSHLGKKSKELLPDQVYSTRKQYPAFHFALSGCGYSKQNEVANTLTRINPNIKVHY
jgi:hypothetical protein